MTRPAHKIALLGWGAAHLLVVACAVVGFRPSADSAIAACIYGYGALTGATDSHGYFSPAIPDQVLIELTAVDAEGDRTVEVLGTGHTQTEMRIFSMTHLFNRQKVIDLHAQSLAAYALGRYPEAQFVVVTLRLHRLPSLAAARGGEGASDEEFYRGIFDRGDNEQSIKP